jgi:hypothetical protein
MLVTHAKPYEQNRMAIDCSVQIAMDLSLLCGLVMAHQSSNQVKERMIKN